LNREEGNMRAAFDNELTVLQAQLVELAEVGQTQLDDALAALATGRPRSPRICGWSPGYCMSMSLHQRLSAS
jgi:hypothetical protein